MKYQKEKDTFQSFAVSNVKCFFNKFLKRMVFRALSNIHKEAFLQKQLTTKSPKLYS